MTKKDYEIWLGNDEFEPYPLTIIADRYGGTYSGASYLAFPLDFSDIPLEVCGNDIECSEFFEKYTKPIGKGRCPDEARDNLVWTIKQLIKG